MDCVVNGVPTFLASGPGGLYLSVLYLFTFPTWMASHSHWHSSQAQGESYFKQVLYVIILGPRVKESLIWHKFL